MSFGFFLSGDELMMTMWIWVVHGTVLSVLSRERSQLLNSDRSQYNSSECADQMIVPKNNIIVVRAQLRTTELLESQ